jgi:hypothetical protein
MEVNIHGGCRYATNIIISCAKIDNGFYEVTFPDWAFDKLPMLVVNPIGGTADSFAGYIQPFHDTVNGVWVIDYAFNDGLDHYHFFIAATGY